MEPKNCEHGIPDGIGCMICDTDGAVEACECNIPNKQDTIITTTTVISPSLPIPMARITPRVEYLINPNPNQCDPPTQGIEIAFSADNYMAVRLANNHEIGFVLSRAAALQLADLINLELPRNEFNLAG